jgi:hypothetical protein
LPDGSVKVWLFDVALRVIETASTAAITSA